MKNRGMVRRPLALTAATTIALGGLFFSTPAFADTADQPEVDSTDVTSVDEAAGEATSADAPAEQAAPAVIKAADDAGIVAWGDNAAGDPVVVVVSDDADDAQIDAFAAEAFESDDAAPIVVEIDSAPESYADGDIVGGQGYLGLVDSSRIGACSFGFAAWSPSGDPAMLSAGHCALDWEDSFLSIPGLDPAVGGPGYEYEQPIDNVGTFGFSQFGGPGNSTGYDENIPLPDQHFTDISVIDIASGYTPLPEVTDWTSATNELDSLAESTVNITAVGTPVAGPVSKSGRTTGFTTGDIVVSSDVDTHILDGWANIDDHIVRGFSSNVLAAPGDSGGAVIQGSTAVGVISGGTAASAGSPQWTWSTLLTDALTYTDGYTVALHIDAPVVTAPASGSTVVVGATVTGTAPGADEVEITSGGSTTTVAVTDGAFSFAAPGTPGDYSYSLVAVRGFDSSSATSYQLSVETAPTPVPAITSPTDGATVVDEVTSVGGTGLPGATVTVTVDGEDHDVTVDGAGNWTLTGLDLSYGEHTISAVQTANDDPSDAATATFNVVLAAPGVTSITTGSTFAHDNAPSSLSGSGIDGATVTVVLTSTEPAASANTASAFATAAAASGTFTATVANGIWTVDFGGSLQPGSYTASATQALNGVSSAPASVSFQVMPANTGGGGDNGNGGDTGNGGNGGNDDGNLATTGADMMVPLAASAGALVLVAGGITLLMIRRRQLAQG